MSLFLLMGLAFAEEYSGERFLGKLDAFAAKITRYHPQVGECIFFKKGVAPDSIPEGKLWNGYQWSTGKPGYEIPYTQEGIRWICFQGLGKACPSAHKAQWDCVDNFEYHGPENQNKISICKDDCRARCLEEKTDGRRKSVDDCGARKEKCSHNCKNRYLPENQCVSSTWDSCAKSAWNKEVHTQRREAKKNPPGVKTETSLVVTVHGEHSTQLALSCDNGYRKRVRIVETKATFPNAPLGMTRCKLKFSPSGANQTIDIKRVCPISG